MPDVQCPVCGTQNSSDEEFCSFCNAILKTKQLDPKSDASRADLRDWLQSLRSSAGSNTQVSSQEESMPDWLGDLPEQPTDVPGDKDITIEDRTISSSSEAVEKERETPFQLREFISDMKFSDELESEAATTNEFNGEASQWLSRINRNKDEQYDQSPKNLERLSDLEDSSTQIEQPVRSGLFSQEGEKDATIEKEIPIGIPDFGMRDELEVEKHEGESTEEAITSEVDFLNIKSASEQPFVLDETGLSNRSIGEVAEPFEEVEQAARIETPAREPIIEKLEEELQLKTSIPDQTYREQSSLNSLKASDSDFDLDTGFSTGEDITALLTQDEQNLGDLGTIPDEASSLWLKEAASEAEILETLEGEEESDFGLVPAELPSWLQAMRPAEATNITAETLTKPELEKPEVAGPLAGLRGALPAEPDISQTQKPSSYSIKLQVTEIQQSQAALLEGMVQTEGEARPVPVRPEITSQHVLRIAFAIILILSVLVPIATGIPQVGLPADVPGISRSIQLIGNLSTGVPVLLAIDYAPGFSGEMDAVTASVVDHLMRQGVYLTIVSTTPTGPAQAERLIASVSQEGNHGYSYSNQYINLGLIPGGFAGLLRFSEAPSLVLPREILGKPAWKNQPLNGVKDVSGFSMVIVATENPDTARSWIEQVQPGLQGVPLILVVSSQAEPILRPYYDAIPQQVQGLIGGLTGGVLYQSQNGKNGQALLYWPSFSISMMFAGLLIVIGGLINLTFAYAERRKERDRNAR